jgi:hypothetical protein
MRGLSPLQRARGAFRLAIIFRTAAFIPLVIGSIYLLVLLPSAPSFSIVQATVESVSFNVVVPELTQIRLNGYSLASEAALSEANLGFKTTTLNAAAAKKTICPTGMLVPEIGTRVTYKRYGTDPVSIVVERSDGKPAATFEQTGTDIPAAARSASWLRLDGQPDSDDDDSKKDKKSAQTCDGKTLTRLPVYGFADIGAEIRPAARGEEPSSGTLIEGTLDIFGRTIELGSWHDENPRIYPASTTTITLPPGSRITEFVTKGEGRHPWAGFAQTDADAALGLKLTTDAPRLAIVRPGLGLKPEVLAIGLFTQLANDPSLISAQLIAAFLFAIFQIFGSGASWYSTRSIAEAPAPRE